jgi:hypothetical protein
MIQSKHTHCFSITIVGLISTHIPYVVPIQPCPVLLQAGLEAELAKKKARAARFNLPVKTTAEEVRPECQASYERNAQGHSLNDPSIGALGCDMHVDCLFHTGEAATESAAGALQRPAGQAASLRHWPLQAGSRLSV